MLLPNGAHNASDADERRGSIPGSRLRSLRWLALLVPFLGLLPGVAPFGHESEFGWLTLVSAAACALLLTVLGRPARQTLWAWLLLLIFLIGYYVQTDLVSLRLNARESLVEDFTPEWYWLTPDDLARGYAWITLAFAVFCCVATACLSLLPWRSSVGRRGPEEISERRLRLLLAALLGLVLALGAARALLGIGVMGIEAQRLPFRLDTIIFRSQSHLIPGLILLGAWAADRIAWRFGSLAFLGLLLTHSLMVGLFSGSKSGFVKFALPVFFLWLCARQITRRRLLVVAASLSAMLVAYPIMAALRTSMMRVQAEGGRIALGEVAADALSRDVMETGTLVLRHMALRVIGASGVWFAQRELRGNPAWADWLQGDDPLVVYYTRDVVGVRTPDDFRAPGLTAAFMLVGGQTGMVVLWAAFTTAMAFVWLVVSKMRTWPVAQAQAAVQLLFFASDGTLQAQDLAACALAIAVCELTFIVWLRQGRQATSPGSGQSLPSFPR